MCIRHQDKVTTATAAGPCCLFRWDGPDSHQRPFITEHRRGRPRPRKGRKVEMRHAQMLTALQGTAVANPESLKDKAPGKCLICRKADYWAKECPNRDKSPKTTCYKCHQLVHWSALCPGDPRASRSRAKPFSWWFNRTEAARSSQPACHR